jgi:hypothetical protein
MRESNLYRINRKPLARGSMLLLRDASGGIAAKAARNSKAASSAAFVFSDRNGAVFARATREFLTPLLYNYVVETTQEPGARGFTIHFKLFSWPVRMLVTRNLTEWMTVTADEHGNRFCIHEEGRVIAKFERQRISLTSKHRIELIDERYEGLVFILVALWLYRSFDSRKVAGDG